MFVQIFIIIAAVANIPGCLAQYGVLSLGQQAFFSQYGVLSLGTQAMIVSTAIALSGLQCPIEAIEASAKLSAMIGFCNTNPLCMSIMTSIYIFIMANPFLSLGVALSLFTSHFYMRKTK